MKKILITILILIFWFGSQAQSPLRINKFLIDSLKGNGYWSIFHDSTHTGQWGLLGGGGNSGSGLRYGVSGEDYIAAQDRNFNFRRQYEFIYDSVYYMKWQNKAASGRSYIEYDFSSLASPQITQYLQSTTGYNTTINTYADANNGYWTSYTSGGFGNQYINIKSNDNYQFAQIGNYRNQSGQWVDQLMDFYNDGTNANSYWRVHREKWTGSTPFTDDEIAMDSIGIRLRTRQDIGASPANYKGLWVLKNSDLKFDNYPNSRDDGNTTKALYISNASGDVVYGTVTPAIASVTGLGTGVATALGINTGSAGAFVTFNGAGGTPSSITLTNGTGLPVASGISGFGTGVATALQVNVGSAGAFVTFNGALGTPSSGTLTNATGLPEGGLSLTDITTNNTSTSQHGFFPKLTSNTVYYVNNSGALTALALGASGTVLTSNGATSAPTFTASAGGGTVTSFAAPDANGFDFTVTNPTTTPSLAVNLSVGFFSWYSTFDDFFSSGTYAFSKSNAGTGSSAAAMTTSDIIDGWSGGYTFSTGTTNSGFCYFASPNSTNAVVSINSSYRYNVGMKCRFEDLSTVSERYSMWYGFLDNITPSSSVDGIYFRYIDTDSSGKFICGTVSNSSRTEVASSVTVAADTDYELHASIFGGSAYFWIRTGTGAYTLVATISTNIPSGTARATGSPLMRIDKTVGTTARLMYVDWAAWGVMNQ